MKAYFLPLLSLFFSFSLFSCQSTDSTKQELWIYTSLYKDTIADLTDKLKKDFPNTRFRWYQAGSEEIAAKVNAENIAGRTKAHILISSDRFWYEEMASKGYLHAYASPISKKVDASLRHPESYYSTLSIPVMVLAYNGEAVAKEDAPKSFKELGDVKWNKKVTTGSPLASGTNFVTLAMLQHTYGWNYVQKLKNNKTISQGGNSAVIRRLQNKERVVGWVLLENLLRLRGKDSRIKTVYPEDGVILQANVIAITKKKQENYELQKRFVDWMYGPKGQKAMTRSYMYSPLPAYAPPEGAPPLKSLPTKKAFSWTRKFIKQMVLERVEIKEKFSEIMFQ